MVFGYLKDYNNWSNDNYQEHLYTAGAVLSSAAANYLYNNYGQSEAPPVDPPRKMFQSSSLSSKSSTSVEQSGPIQHMTFPAYWNNTRSFKKVRREGQDNDDSMPWKKLKQEIAYRIQSPTIPVDGGLAPCTFFGWDLGTSETDASTDINKFGIVNPFNLGTANNYSDIGRLLQQAGFTAGQNGWLDFDNLQGMIELFNNSNVGCELEVYHCIIRKDINKNVTQVEEPHGIMDSFTLHATTDGLMAATGMLKPEFASSQNSYLSPYMSSQFCSRWNIMGQKKCRLGPGETLKIDFESPIRGVLRTSNLFETAVTKAYSRHILIRFVGQMGISTAGEGQTICHMPVDILSIFHVWAVRRYLPSTSAIFMDTDVLGANRPSTVASENIVLPGNARDPVQFEVAE